MSCFFARDSNLSSALRCFNVNLKRKFYWDHLQNCILSVFHFLFLFFWPLLHIVCVNIHSLSYFFNMLQRLYESDKKVLCSSTAIWHIMTLQIWSAPRPNSKHPRIDVKLILIRHLCIWSISNRHRSEGLCYLCDSEVAFFSNRPELLSHRKLNI